MHVRLSMVRGTPVVDEQTQQAIGALQNIVLHPDTGEVLGFLVLASGVLASGTLFLSALDILSWGTRIHVKSEDRLSPPGDLVRIAPLLESRRTILGQPVVTRQSRRTIGTCRDVQFDTKRFRLEWIFPRFLFIERRAVPASDIVEVTDRAVIVKEPLKPKRALVEKIEDAPAALLKEVVPSAGNLPATS